MELGIAIVSISCIIAMIYFTEGDTTTILQLAFKSLFALGIATFTIQYVSALMKRWRKQKENCENQSTVEKFKLEQEKYKEKIQSESSDKAESYKERILIPREENKRKQKEEKFAQFMGPAWKGKGQALGGSTDDAEGGQSPQDAAKLRNLPENINTNVAEKAKKELEKRQRKTKKIIEIPEEPEIDSPGCVCVSLRTPLGIHQRRFHHSNTMQNILDFMTTLGFSKHLYTVCTSYPRQCLQDQKEKTLLEMGFLKKVTLNVEEME